MKYCLLWLLFSLVAHFTWAQSETATVSGQVVDPSGLNITGAQVKLVDIDRDTSTGATTNKSGLYAFPSVRPGRYRMEVTTAGFRVVNVTGLIVNVQDHIEQNFRLQIGSVAESITVTAGAPLVNTTDGTISTVVDRQFAENLPMNGRSFQTLIQLTPGVVLTASNQSDNGQFSINGQRAASNYWMLDGVSANIGIGVNAAFSPGNSLSGSIGSFSATGGTNSLVSVDAMQEFRIQTSTFAPEFGRTPGGQISIVTRSGANQFHGTAFDYLRNDVLDASDWFNGYINTPPLPKAKERQNDFGGTLSGPIVKDRMFFFFSYEGLRLRLPQTTLTTVPDLVARQGAPAAMQPYLNAFSLDPNQPDLGNGIAQFNASYSNPASLDAYSLRIDHRLTDKLNLFGRYNYSPSSLSQRGGGLYSLSTVSSTQITTQTGTIGATWVPSSVIANDFRFNYSRTTAVGDYHMDNFGGAVPLTSLPFPDPYTSDDALLFFEIVTLQQGRLYQGRTGRNLLRQINLVDSVSVQKATHSLKFGVDFRRLTPQFDPQAYVLDILTLNVQSAMNGNLLGNLVADHVSPTFLFRNLGIYAQDTWRVTPGLSVTYGLRWDVDFVPASLSGPNFPAVTGFDLNNMSSLALAPTGTPPYKTRFGNVSPRLGVAYQLFQSPQWQTVIRGGFGVFYDLATSEAGNLLQDGAYYPFGNSITHLGGTLPLDPSSITPPPITPASLSSGWILAFDPHLQLPYTLEWNTSVEQSLGKEQTLSASYIGAAGRRLLLTAFAYTPNPKFFAADLVTNAGTSEYDALQIQFQRRLSHGLQTLASYTWAHSIDTGSAGSNAILSNAFVPSSIGGSNRGPSDFDIRNAFSAALTYDFPVPNVNAVTSAILGGWSLQSIILARSAPPVDVSDADFFNGNFSNGSFGDVRPDLVPGQSMYLYGSQFPGAKAFNLAAFTNPPIDPNTGLPLRQGDVPRNFLRGFGATQWDFAIHREFRLREQLKLQFRAEIFNVLNHPNFGPPVSDISQPNFGLSAQTLGNSLNGSNLGSGAFNPLYQMGGPRSMEFALKLQF
jgi:hypothetical protein